MKHVIIYLAALNCIHFNYKQTFAFAFQPKPIKIQICQNKDCCKNFPSKYDGGLPQTIQDLIPTNVKQQNTAVPIQVETTGCLSKCSHGPNVSINDRIFGHINDVLLAAAILEVGVAVDSPAELMAAVEYMANANKSTNVVKKVKFLNSAIESLQKGGLTSTTAMAHALILRADAYLESSLSNPRDADQALEDVTNAIDIDSSLHGRAWRVAADVKEAKGDTVGAMEAISKWAEVNPEFRLKATKELKRLEMTTSNN